MSGKSFLASAPRAEGVLSLERGVLESEDCDALVPADDVSPESEFFGAAQLVAGELSAAATASAATTPPARPKYLDAPAAERSIPLSAVCWRTC